MNPAIPDECLYTHEVLTAYDAGRRNFSHCAILHGTSLRGQMLDDCDFSYSDLIALDLENASLCRANFSHAVVDDANFDGANLANANFSYASCTKARFYAATVSDADFTQADMRNALLRRTDWTQTNLECANLQAIRDDLYWYIAYVPKEVEGLLATLRAGRIDGTSYYSDTCACLAGTCERLVRPRDEQLYAMLLDLRDASSLREEWFWNIETGDTPENSKIAHITERWLTEWLARSTDVVVPVLTK